jgi:hypothetical protein
MTAQRSFFLVDEQGIVRQQWLLGPAGGNTVMPSDPILKAVQQINPERRILQARDSCGACSGRGD